MVIREPEVKHICLPVFDLLTVQVMQAIDSEKLDLLLAHAILCNVMLNKMSLEVKPVCAHKCNILKGNHMTQRKHFRTRTKE